MIVTAEIDLSNRNQARGIFAVVLASTVALGFFFPQFFLFVAATPLIYWLVRRRCLRRIAVAQRPFPPDWLTILESRVQYYRLLPEDGKIRFRKMVSVFLDEVRVTGVRTTVDETVRVLVAASAIIPVFGFRDWEYHRLGEVLVYPGPFGRDFSSNESEENNILGLTGLGHLRGVMVLSKPSLLAAFSENPGKNHVGVHEFAHLVEQEEIEGALPSEVPSKAVRQWVGYVARELAHPSHKRRGISDYAYTNEHEFFAVLSEYFFGSPEVLRKKDPHLYDLLRHLFHQDPARMMGGLLPRPGRFGRNNICPCGSGRKFKNCCSLADAKVE